MIDYWSMLFVFVLATFIGLGVIRRVSRLLYTPLMSLTNAISAIVAGFIVGVPLSRVPLTAVPQRTALSHAFGGLAAGLVGTAEYFLGLGEGGGAELTAFRMSAIVAEIILGFLTFTGSLMATGK